MLSLFPRDVLVEILDLIESVSEGLPTYPNIFKFYFYHDFNFYANQTSDTANVIL